MDLNRRQAWQDDQGVSGTLLEITTCITCPDSDGFKFENDEIQIENPICKWGKEIPLDIFPFIPYWCPKLEQVEPHMGISYNDADDVIHKSQCLQKLSQESKLVLSILFELPEDFIHKQTQWFKSLISNTIREFYPWSKRTQITNKIYDEIKNFTHELIQQKRF